MTAFSTGCRDSARRSAFIFFRISALTCEGAFLLVAHLHPGVAVVGLDDLVGHHVHVLADDRVLEPAADQALDREEGVLGIGHRLALGRHADQHLAVLGVGHHRGRRAHALLVLDHPDVLALHDRDAAVRGAEIDTDNLAHSNLSRETR